MSALYFKMNKKAVCSVFIFFFIYNAIAQPQLKTFDTEIKIWSEKTEFFIHETIWIFYKVENRGSTGPRISYGELNECMVVKDVNENIVYRSNWDSYVLREKTVPMKSGEVNEKVMNLLSAYGTNGGIKNSPIYTLPPGKYLIYCIWDREKDYESIISNTIELVISEPIGSEKDAKDLYVEGLIALSQKSRDIANEKYDKLLMYYPNSRYSKSALYFKIYNCNRVKTLDYYKKSMEASKRLLEDYPDVKYQRIAFDSIMKYYQEKGDLEEAKRYFLKLKNETKVEGIKEKAEKKLEYIEKLLLKD